MNQFKVQLKIDIKVLLNYIQQTSSQEEKNVLGVKKELRKIFKMYHRKIKKLGKINENLRDVENRETLNPSNSSPRRNKQKE